MFTSQFNRFIEPARGYPQIWRIILGLALIAIIYVAVLLAFVGCVWLAVGTDRLFELSGTIVTSNKPISVVVMLFSFLGMALGPMIVVRLLHKRRASTLFGQRAKVLRDFVYALAVVSAIYVVVITLWSLRFDAVPNVDFGTWITFLPLVLVALAIQTGAEELVFRGYLQQQLAARFRSPIMWMLLPSLLFGALHYDPSNPIGTIAVVIGSTALFGLVAADLTRISGSLGAAWGFHFANNLFAIGFLTIDGPLSSFALYKTPYKAAQLAEFPWMIVADLLTVVLTWWIIRQTLRR